MWGHKEKLDPLLIGGHMGHPHHIGAGVPPHPGHPHHLYRSMDIGAAQTARARPHLLWKGDTQRRKRFEPFCSPVAPHVPIRERLARRGTSADVNEDIAAGSYCSSFYGQPRRRRMSLLQTLRQQNRQLADSGFDVGRQRADSESSNRETVSPPMRHSPPHSPTKKAFASIKAKLFGRKDKDRKLESTQSTHSIELPGETTFARSRKSPSTTNDSGRGSQGHLEEKQSHERETVAIVEREDEETHDECLPRMRRMRTFSCPNLPGLFNLSHSHFPSEHGDELTLNSRERNSSPVSAADCLLQRRLLRRALEVERKRLHETSIRQNHHQPPWAAIAIAESCSESTEDVTCVERKCGLNQEQKQRNERTGCCTRDTCSQTPERMEDPVFDVVSTTSEAQTEDLCDYDDVTSLMLDHFLPLSRSEACDQLEDCSQSSELSINEVADDTANNSDHECTYGEKSSGVSNHTSVSSTAQTDLSLVHVGDRLASYLHSLDLDELPSPEGMNFIAKHFFEYQSFVNLPHKAVQLHKQPPSQAGTDPSVGWAPKNMNKAGKNQPAPAARASKNHRDPRPNGTKHGRAARHEHREWGDRHGELKEEKVVPHKDAWSKFLANEDPSGRTMFECDFEEQVLQTEEESLPERIAKSTERDDLDFQMAYNATRSSSACGCELLAILTYAPLVQFVTATVKKAKALPYNNSPFARIMLFDGRRLVEQKQTTVNPSVGLASSLDTSSSASKPSSSSSLSSSSGDAAFSESFLFHVAPSKLDTSHVVVEMFDHNSSGQTVSVGHCVIGRRGVGTGSAHWHQMVKKSGLPVCMWHRICRPSDL